MCTRNPEPCAQLVIGGVQRGVEAISIFGLEVLLERRELDLGALGEHRWLVEDQPAVPDACSQRQHANEYTAGAPRR